MSMAAHRSAEQAGKKAVSVIAALALGLSATVAVRSEETRDHSRALERTELADIVRLNPSVAFADWAMEVPLDDDHAALTLQELGVGGEETAGRKYVFAILHKQSKRIILTLETGTLDLGLNSRPVEVTSQRAIFSVGTDYREERRTQYAYQLDPPQVLGRSTLPPQAARDDLP